MDPSFPLKLWDKLLPQAELTLNLLRQSNSTPTISTHAHLFGNFDFNRMPLAPMGCSVQIHEEASKRRTWAPHSVDGYYLGTSPEHYRAHRIFVKATNAERITETVFFKHKYLTNPTVTHADRVVQAAKELHNALNKKKQGMERATMEGLRELSNLYLKMAKNSSPKSWEDDANTEDKDPPKAVNETPVATISENNDQPPKRATKEVANLESSRIIGNNGPPSSNTRARFAVATAALATVVANSTADAHQWKQKNYSPLTQELGLNEIVNAVLEGDKVLNYRQLIKHPELGEQWRYSSANEFGRLA